MGKERDRAKPFTARVLPLTVAQCTHHGKSHELRVCRRLAFVPRSAGRHRFPDRIARRSRSVAVSSRHSRARIGAFFRSSTESAGHRSGLPFAVSSTLHAGIFAAVVFVFTFGPAPVATTLTTVDPPTDPMRLVFLNIPGPGGGGGGGGLLQKAPPPKAMREGRKKISSPMPKREPPEAD